MESKTYSVLGSIIFLAGLIGLIMSVPEAIYKTFEVHGDYWMWGFVLVSLLFVLLGIYYSLTGIKQKETNGKIYKSMILIFISIILLFVAYTYPLLSKSNYEMMFMVMFLFGLPASILILIGFILFVIGWSKK